MAVTCTLSSFGRASRITSRGYERPGLLDLLAAVEEKGRAFDVVVVSALDRLGRGRTAETAPPTRKTSPG
jgi:DNA invertase Pin-like site-specific DNA recombinase